MTVGRSRGRHDPRRRCDGCGSKVEMLITTYGHDGARRVRRNLCPQCHGAEAPPAPEPEGVVIW